MPRKKKSAAEAEAEQIPVPEPGKAITVHTSVTRFAQETAAPVIPGAPGAPDEDDEDDEEEADDELDLIEFDEASALLDEVNEAQPVSLVTVYHMPTAQQIGRGQAHKPEYCGQIELSADYQAEIQAAWGGGRYRLVVRWPAGHHKGGSIRKQWDVQIAPPRPIPSSGVQLTATGLQGQTQPAAYPPPAPAERPLTLEEELTRMARIRKLLIEAGMAQPPQIVTAPAANPEPQTPDAYFLKFAMADEATRAQIISKYLGGAEKGEGSSEWIELAREYGPLLMSILGSLAQQMAQPPPAPVPPQIPPPSAPQPAPAPSPRPVDPTNQAPRQMTPEEAITQFLLNSIQRQNPIEAAVGMIREFEAKRPQLVEWVEDFINTPARVLVRHWIERYPDTAEFLSQPFAKDYLEAVQDALVQPEDPEPIAEAEAA